MEPESSEVPRNDASKVENNNSPYFHQDYTLKAAEHFLTYLKGEQDRHIARARVFEARAQTLATFAGAAGSLAALLKPTQANGITILLLLATGFATLTVLWLAFRVHKNREGSTGGDKEWGEKTTASIWSGSTTPMALIHQLHENYVENIQSAKQVAEDKAKDIKVLQNVFLIQLVCVLLTIVVSAAQGFGGNDVSKNTAPTPTAATSQSGNSK